MFAQSYNPFDYNNQPPHSNPPSPRTQEIRKKQDNARRQRMVKIERRHQAEFERMQRMEDKLNIEDHRRRTETRQRHIEEEEELRRRELDIFSRKYDDIRASRFPPLPFIYTSTPSSSSQESATLPPSLNVLKSNEPVMTSEHKSKNNTIRRCDTGLSTICTLQDSDDIVDDDEIPTIPHIVAVDNVTDDDEDDDEDLDSLWIYQVPSNSFE